MPIKEAVARIYDGDNQVVGAGFLVDDTHVMTCAHVVNSTLGRPRESVDQPAGPIALDFPLLLDGPSAPIEALVTVWQPMGQGDIAVLVLQSKRPDGTQPVTFGSTENMKSDQECKIVRFPSGYESGNHASGIIRGRQADGWFQVDVAPGSQYFIEDGFSGAPVWGKETERILGMVVTRDATKGIRVAFLIPAETLKPLVPAPIPSDILPTPSGAPPMRDHVFVSYDHVDRALVERLAGDLRSHGYTTWIDFEGIRGGDVWRQAIVDGIYASAVVLVALSPDSVCSEWVEIELQAARSFNKKIIPLLVRPLDTEESQAAYRRLHIDHIQYRDFTRGYETAFRELLKDLPLPQVGVPGHCKRVAAELLTRPWGLDHFIQSEARLLPIDASPYEDGIVKGQPENLIHRLHQSHRLIVLGEPGMGKTVALERLAWELATGQPLVVPVLIRLFEYDGQPLLEWVYLNLRSYGEIKHRGSDETRTFLMDERQPFHCYFLLDGLNEVRSRHRETVLAEIRRLAMEFPRHPIVVTSRVQDDGWQQLRQGAVFQDTFLVQPIYPEQAQRYLDAHLDRSDGVRLWNQLDERMQELATTPLLLWLIKEAWLEALEQQGIEPVRIPDNRGALYQSFVNRLLKRDDERRLTEQVSEAARLAALEKLARMMHEDQTLTVTRSDASAVVKDPTTMEALLVNGLLVPVSRQLLRFAPHQTLQEHFAARSLKDDIMNRVQGRGVARLVRRFNPGPLRYADDAWWAETFIQLAGLVDDPDALVRALAEVNPWLALWCMQEGRAVDDATRDIIRTRSDALVQSPRVQDRRRAAEVLAHLQTPRVLEPLAILSLDSDALTARTALRAVLSFGESGEQAFKHAFSTVFARKSPQERAAWGRSIADIDPRPGVGLRPDGVPDIDWVKIPAGEFIYQNDERLTLPTFYIARYPVTYRQFQAFIDAPDGFYNAQWWDGLAVDDEDKGTPSEQGFKHWNHPRENVSWWETVAFCRWLSAKLGYEVRLPTEQEWEKAARGTDGREYPYGNGFDVNKGNAQETDIRRTSAVGILEDGASPYGVLDMSGNVWEWCLNEFQKPENTALGGREPRVLRGGSWNYSVLNAGATRRDDGWPSLNWSSYFGFRVVCMSPE